MPIHPSWVCHCQTPVPLIHLGEDTGLCSVCNCVYDERLYEMRLRQHSKLPPGLHEGASLHEIMVAVSPEYKAASA